MVFKTPVYIQTSLWRRSVAKSKRTILQRKCFVRLPTSYETSSRSHLATLRMVGKPEDKENSDESFKVLEADIREYLETRAESEEASDSPLAYVNLRDAGRLDLVSRIMDAGGYIEVSKRVGAPVDESRYSLLPSVSVFDTASQFVKSDDFNASLAIGENLEKKFENIDHMNQNSKGSVSPMKTSRVVRPSHDVLSGEELVRQNESLPNAIVDEKIAEGERLTLTATMRIGLLMLTGTSAAGFGRASVGVVDHTTIVWFQAIASALVFAHVTLAIYAALILAPQRNRNPYIWFTKVILSGPIGLTHMRSLAQLKKE